MIPESVLPTLRGTCRTLQVIVVALATGVSLFAVIAISQAHGKLNWALLPAQMENVVFLLLGIMLLVGSVVVPSLLPLPQHPPAAESKSTPQGDLALQLAAGVQTRTIIGCAMLEAAAFANLLAVFLHGYGPSLVMSAVLFAFLVFRFPTWGGYLEMIEAAQRRLEESSLQDRLRR